MMMFLSYLALGVGLLLTALLLRLAIKLLRVDSIEGEKSASRASSIKEAIRGRSRMHEDWIPDARVKGGMIYNKRAKRLEISGRLSDESFDRAFDSGVMLVGIILAGVAAAIGLERLTVWIWPPTAIGNCFWGC